MNRIHSLFIPHTQNNFRAKLLHHTSLLVIAFLFLVLSFSFTSFHKAHPGVLGISYDITSEQLVALTNKVRMEHNLSPLRINNRLTEAARFKAAYMFQHDFWAHFAPDGTSPWYFIKNSGYQYEYAGENLAKGFTNSSDVVSAWMNSPTHRENLLSPKYKDIGFAVLEGKLLGEDTVLIVQMFGALPGGVAENDLPNPPQIQVAVQKDNAKVLASKEDVNSIIKNPLIDIRFTTKSAIFIVLITLISVLILDLFVVESKKIPRIIGHNIDHIMLISLFLLFVLIESNGGIL